MPPQTNAEHSAEDEELKELLEENIAVAKDQWPAEARKVIDEAGVTRP